MLFGLTIALCLKASVYDHFNYNGIWYTITKDVVIYDNNRYTQGDVKVGYFTENSYAGAGGTGHIDIPKTVKYNGYYYGVKGIGKHAFRGSKITGMTLPESVQSIDEFACMDLECINLDNVKDIKESAFENCDGIKCVEFNSSVNLANKSFLDCDGIKRLEFNSAVNLGEYSFSDCDSLLEVYIMNGMYFSKGAFYNCKSLSSIVMKSTSNYPINIDKDNVFAGCSSLKHVYSFLTKQIDKYPPNETTFYNIDPNATLYVVNGFKSVYESTDWCKYFKNVEIILPTYGEIFSKTIPMCNDSITLKFVLTDVEPIEVSIDEIVDETSSVNISNISIPNHIQIEDLNMAITAIGDYAFKQMKVVSLVINEGVRSIGKEAFGECVDLESIIIPESVEFISNSFFGCNKVNSVSVSWLEPAMVNVDPSNFCDLPENAVLNDPAGTLEKYESHAVWGRFSQIIEQSPISLGYIDVVPKDKVLLPVRLRTDKNILGVQFKITLPNGIHIVEDDEGWLITELTNRSEDMLVMGRRDFSENNSYNFVMFSLLGESLKGDNGVILKIELEVQDIPLGEYVSSLSDVFVSNSSFQTELLNAVSSKINVDSAYPGDVNGDGRISIVDVSMIINEILKKENFGFNQGLADMNKDGRISIVDATMITNIILEK